MASPSIPPYEEIEHTADLALRAHGATLRELFTNAAKGMFHLIGDCPLEPSSGRYSVQLESPDAETLLIDWMNELLFLAEIHERILGGFDLVHIDETHLHARVSGAPPARILASIKAATFHNLAIQRDEGGYTVTIVFDV